MQSNDLSTALSQTHRGRDLAIGGSVVSAALIAGMLVCLPILTPTLASANGPSIMSAIAGGGTVSNAVLKGDRLSNSRSKIEHPDAGAVSARQRWGHAKAASSDRMRKRLRRSCPGRQRSGAVRH